MELSVGILCGGRSRRMGMNKALLPWEDTTLLGRILKEMRGAGPMYVSVRDGQDFGILDARYVVDENLDIGPIEGMRRILSEAETEYVFLCAVDMPYVDRRVVDYLEQFLCNDYDAYVMEDAGGLHPLCGIYSRKMLPVLERQIQSGNYKIQDAFTGIRMKRIPIELSCLSGNELKNVNTAVEYQSLRKPQPVSLCHEG